MGGRGVGGGRWEVGEEMGMGRGAHSKPWEGWCGCVEWSGGRGEQPGSYGAGAAVEETAATHHTA